MKTKCTRVVNAGLHFGHGVDRQLLISRVTGKVASSTHTDGKRINQGSGEQLNPAGLSQAKDCFPARL
jgi:hypothetical protein